jgi:Oligonucleotide/oligosaccharide-binding (OB)-fold
MLSAGAQLHNPFPDSLHKPPLFLHCAGSYRVLATGQEVAIHPSSTLSRGRTGAAPVDAIVFGELVRTAKTYARDVTAIDINWLPELVPHFFARVGRQQQGAA